MPKSKKTKFDRLVLVFKSLEVEFLAINSPELNDFSNKFLSRLPYWIDEMSLRATKSQIAGGMEQALQEFPVLLANLKASDEIRQLAIKKFDFALQTTLPEFNEKNQIALEKIFKRGKIRSEKEYYLLINRIDEIEGDSDVKVELLTAYEIIDKYEAGV